MSKSSLPEVRETAKRVDHLISQRVEGDCIHREITARCCLRWCHLRRPRRGLSATQVGHGNIDREFSELHYREGSAHVIEGKVSREHLLSPIGGEAKHLEIDIAARETQSRVSDAPSNYKRAAAFGADEFAYSSGCFPKSIGLEA